MNTIIRRQVGWISAIALGLLMQAAVADKVYVSGFKGIQVIDTDSNSVINTLYDIGGDLNKIAPRHELVASPDGTRLYVTNGTEQKLSVIDTKTDKVLKDIPLSLVSLSYGKSITVNPSGTRVYVASQPYQYADKVSMVVVDTVLNKEIATLNLPDITRIVFDPSGSYFYGYSNQGNNIYVFNANTNSLITTIPVNSTSAFPEMHDMVATGTHLYVNRVENSGDSIYIINTQSNQLVGNISAGGYSLSYMQVNSGGTRLYACAQTDVVVFNLSNNTLETTIPMIGGICSGIGINASGTRVYVSKENYGYLSRALHVIDTESNKIVSTISPNLGGGTTQIAVASSATITPVPRATARISSLNTQAQLPIIGGLGINGTGKLNLLFQGSTLDNCISPSMTLRKYPSGEVVDNYHWNGTTFFSDYYLFGNANHNAHPSTGLALLSNNPKNVSLVWDLPAGYYTVSLDALGCNEQGKLSIDLIEEDSSSSAKLMNVSANAMLPITSTITTKDVEGVQTMFRGFKVAPCVDANLELKNSTSGALLASNDNWETDVNITAAKALPQYLQPIDSSDAGLLRQLGAQSITATLSSKNTCQGDGVFGMDIIP